MKRILFMCMIAVFVVSISACGQNADAKADKFKGDEMTLSELMGEIQKGVNDMPMTMETELNEDNFSSFTFIDPIEGAEGLVSEAAIGSIAHSTVLLRLPQGSDVQSVAKSIGENVNPRKWICVEAEKTIVSNHGNTILLVMSFEPTADAIAANFDSLAQ